MAQNYSTNRLRESSSEKARLKEELDRQDEKFTESSEVAGAVEAVEQSVETTGRVSEVLSEGSEVNGDSDGANQTDPSRDSKVMSSAQIKAELLKNIPSERVMVAQVKREIEREIKYLHRKAMKMMRSPGEVNHFEMNNLVGKIRELRKLLSSLVKASVEGVKTLWLRFVHGVM